LCSVQGCVAERNPDHRVCTLVAPYKHAVSF
jgi:hypothetical protein